MVDPLTHRTEWEYDALDRQTLLREADPDGPGVLASPETTWTYDAASRVTHVENARHFVTQYLYDGLDRVTKVVLPDPDGGGVQSSPEWQYAYDAAGNIVAETDPRGGVTRRRYDLLGRLVETTLADPDGSGSQRAPVTRLTYDLASQFIAATDPLGRVTSRAYDRLGRIVSLTQPDPDGSGALSSPVTSYAYDPVGNLLEVVDPTGSRTSYQYDKLNRPTVRRDEDPALRGGTNRPLTMWTYDAADQLLTASDPLGRTVQYAYDGLGRVKQITQPDPDGPALPEVAAYVRRQYDLNGNVTRAEDALGQGTNLAYDRLDRVVSTTDARGGVTAFAYDATGNRVALTDPESNTTTWTYDGLDRVTVETNELNKSRLFAYDAADNLIRKTDRLGRVTQYQYDALQRQTREQWLDPSQTMIREFSYGFDAASQLTSAADPAANYSYGYDGLGRVTSETQQIVGLPTVQFASTFTPVGRRASVAASIGGTNDFINNFSYDALHRLTNITQGGQGGNAVAGKEVTFGYNLAGQTTSINRREIAPNVTLTPTTLAYDLAGKLQTLQHGALARYDYDYDPAERIEKITSQRDGESLFTHDATDQLVNDNQPGTADDRAYTYDDNGNRIMAGHVVGANNRLLSDGVFNYEYDDEGNQTAKVTIATGERVEYAWDHRNRLTKITSKTSAGVVTKVVDQSYDIFNQWIKRSVDNDGPGSAVAVDTYFAHEDGQIGLEWEDADGSGGSAPALSHRYLWDDAVDQLLADEQVTSPSSPGNVVWPLTDHLGTIRDAVDVDTSGVVQHVLHRTYNAFGSLTSETNPSAPSSPAADLLFGFTGRPFDDSTGLQNNLHRWYDPVTGQWKSLDPIGFAAGDANLGRYVGNSPTTMVDPNGLENLWNPLTWGIGGTGDPTQSRGWRIYNYVSPITRENWDSTVAFWGSIGGNVSGAATGIVTGESGRALGERAVAMSQNESGDEFDGDAGDWGRLSGNLARDLTGANAIAESVYGVDLAELRELDAMERAQRGAAGVGAMAGTAAGGFSLAGGCGVAPTVLKPIPGTPALPTIPSVPIPKSWNPNIPNPFKWLRNRGTATPPPQGGVTNWRGEPVRIPEGHIMSPRDPAMAAPPIVESGPFTTAQRNAMLAGQSGGTRLSPHHRHQIPTTHGGVIDELPGPGHPSGNIHTAGSPSRHPSPSVFNSMECGKALRQTEIRNHWQAKAQRLIEVEPGVWIDPGF